MPRLISAVVRMVVEVLHLGGRDLILYQLAHTPMWRLLSEEHVLEEVVCLAMLIWDRLARHEVVEPSEEEFYVQEVKKQVRR